MADRNVCPTGLFAGVEAVDVAGAWGAGRLIVWSGWERDGARREAFRLARALRRLLQQNVLAADQVAEEFSVRLPDGAVAVDPAAIGAASVVQEAVGHEAVVFAVPAVDGLCAVAVAHVALSKTCRSCMWEAPPTPELRERLIPSSGCERPP